MHFLNRSPQFPTRSKSKGFTLLICLVLLLMVTITSMHGIDNSAIQEKMTAITYDRSIALQSAEYALRVGEDRADQQAQLEHEGFPEEIGTVDTMGLWRCDTDDLAYTLTDGCNDGLCIENNRNCPDRWLTKGFNGWKTVTGLPAYMGQPQYYVEYLGDGYACNSNATVFGCNRYKIVARSGLGQGRAVVMLESIFTSE